MNLKIAIQMDPIENIDISVDTTFRLALEAKKGIIPFGTIQ